MRTIVGMLMALFGTLGAIAGLYITYTTVIAAMESESDLATGLMVMSGASGLTLALVGLIAMYLALGPKQVGTKQKKRRVDTH